MTSAKSALDMTDVYTIPFLRVAYTMGLFSTNFAFEQKEVQDLINAKDKVGKYDLLLAEQFFNEGALILGHLYQIPIITVTTFGYANYLSSLTGIINPWSYVAHGWKPYTDRMSLTERIDSVFCSLAEEVMRKFWYYPAQNEIIQKHLSKQFKDLPTVKQLERNISVILLNSYMPLEAPRPTSFNMIPVGGLHIKPTKPLPTNIKKFLDDAKHGAIYFSLGKLKTHIHMFMALANSLRQVLKCVARISHPRRSRCSLVCLEVLSNAFSGSSRMTNCPICLPM